MIKIIKRKRHRQDSNLRGQSPIDFKSISLTTRTRCHITITYSIDKIFLNNLNVDYFLSMKPIDTFTSNINYRNYQCYQEHRTRTRV